jgi:hypothetical protein
MGSADPDQPPWQIPRTGIKAQRREYRRLFLRCLIDRYRDLMLAATQSLATAKGPSSEQ